MKRKLVFLVLTIITATKVLACSCDYITPAIEFYQSKYVFEGKVISKIYSKDSTSYEVVFEISKHYKNGDSPKYLKFTFPAEGEYTGIYTSCDWSVELNQKWLVYAYLNNDRLTFDGMCGNSKCLFYREISPYEQKILDNGNSFKIDHYIYQFDSGFNYCKNITNINAILEKGKTKNYTQKSILLYVFINRKGKLKKVFYYKNLITKKDPIFNLTVAIANNKSKPLTEFEIDAIKMIKKVKKWEIKRNNHTKVSVPHIRHIWINYDLKTNHWSYEL